MIFSYGDIPSNKNPFNQDDDFMNDVYLENNSLDRPKNFGKKATSQYLANHCINRFYPYNLMFNFDPEDESNSESVKDLEKGKLWKGSPKHTDEFLVLNFTKKYHKVG